MILLSLLATTCLITLARALPMSYATYRRRELPVDERPELVLLYGQGGLENTDSSPRLGYDLEREYGNAIALQQAEISEVPDQSSISGITRDKKMGVGGNSLSIVNSVDVLRQRVLLELARRKAMQDQRQIDENRRILETIGKRSVHQLDPGYPRRVVDSSENINNHVYTSERQDDQRNGQHQTYTQRIPAERTHDWYSVDDNVIRGSEDDETRKVLSTYHHDRM